MHKYILIILFICVNLVQAQENHNIELLSEFASYRDDVLDIEIRDGLAFLATDDTGIQILDISDLDEIELVGAFWNYGTSSLEIVGDILYSAGNSGLQTIDISNVMEPVLIGQVSPGSDNVHYVDNHILVTANRNLISYDVSDPRNPQQVCTLELDRIDYLQYEGDFVYVRTRNTFTIVDFSDPTELVITDEFELDTGDYRNFAVNGQLMYNLCRIPNDIGSYTDHLHVIDLNSHQIIGKHNFGRYFMFEQ